ncbi:hypothetical protein B0H12DRAFT_104107 [Mycena haematopus]|nr:hypothetical protein B0H12DRAFT_104107 [Mycena haematopus]
MKPHRALACICVFLLCALSTIWCSRFTPTDATLRWIVLELKPTMAVAWLVVAIVLTCALVSPALPRRGAIALPEDTDVQPETTADTANTWATSFLLFSLLVDAAMASFVLFKRGIPAQTGSNSDSFAIAVFFLHGVANCLMICVLAYAVYYGAEFIRAFGGRGPAIPDGDVNDNLEKGTQEN